MPFREAAPATLEDVAARAGVSRSTASRVLTGSPHVSAEAISAVHAAVRELAYVPDTAAQLLAARRLRRS
ncbi:MULTISPECIES: LacI family DNA-binding transcriptional regulator [Microbacterium]|nr:MULTISPECIES: LacI family DNA-binding transcriptional regulator [Microbacterium]